MIYPHFMNVYRVVQETVEGETIETFKKVYSNVKCHLSQKILRPGSDSPVNGASQEFKIFFPLGFSVESGDKLEINVVNKVYTFKAKEPFPYTLLKKQDMVVEEWQE